MTRPWLSVVVPTYNGERYLEAALASVAAEAEANAAGDGIEVVVVDDGSTDASVEIARSFVGRMPLEVIAGVRRGNWVAASNDGLRRATGERVCFLHQDDLWRRGRLRVLQAAFERWPEAGIVCTAARFIGAGGEDRGPWSTPFGSGVSRRTPDEVIPRLLVQNFLCIAAPVFRRTDALPGGLDETLWYTADWDLWLRLAARADTVFSGDATVAFRVHAESQTAIGSRGSEDFRDQLETVLDRHLPAWREDPARARHAAAVERAARAAIDTNVALGALSHGDGSHVWRAVGRVLALGPVGWGRFLRDTRLVERAGARLRERRTSVRL